MSIEKLQRLIKAPNQPIAVGHNDLWPSIESQLGGILPYDYKEIIAIYGLGCIDGFLSILNPFTNNPNLNLISYSKEILESLQTLVVEFDEKIVFPIYPKENGVFPWGITGNGDMIFWRFKKKCFQPPIVIMEGRGPQWEEYYLSTAEFLVKVISRELKIQIFPKGFPSKKPRFGSFD